MNIYNAIMKAADHIERNPQEFSFVSVVIPKEPCGSPGCALGWIGHFAGAARPHTRSISCVAANETYDEETRRLLRLESPLLGITQAEFYERMKDASGSHDWRYSAPHCAVALRLYAEKYHGEEKPKPVSPPDWNSMAAKWMIGDDVRSQEVAA